MILLAGRGPQQSDAYSQALVVKERLCRWTEGDYKELWREAVELTKPSEEKKLEERNAAKAAQLAHEGQINRALQAFDSAGMADKASSTEEEMRREHQETAGL